MPSAEIQARNFSAAPSYAVAFAPALLNPDLDTPGLVAGPGAKAANRRYNVYRNNVTVSLINAVAAVFPVTQRITGPDFFRAMARFYVRAEPPASPLLFEYGRTFPDFIQQYEYAQSVPWLADVARIERAWLDAYHAADVRPLTPGALASVPPERLVDTVLRPHPAARVIRSRYPALSIFAANRREGAGAVETAVETAEPEDALLTRPALDVEVRALPAGGASFLAHLMSGCPLGAAASAALSDNPSFDLAANIAGCLEAGAFTTALAGEG
jgi:hypothetical protein